MLPSTAGFGDAGIMSVSLKSTSLNSDNLVIGGNHVILVI